MPTFTPIRLAAAAAVALPLCAAAEPFEASTLLAPTDSIALKFNDGGGHVALLVRRTGTIEGDGPFAGAAVVEVGLHDLNPPHGADARGYLELTTPAGDIAYLGFKLEAAFVARGDGAHVQTGGHWTLVSGTGAFAGQVGAGLLSIEIVSETERRFVLSGEIGAKL